MEILFGQTDLCADCDCGEAEDLFIDSVSKESFYYKVEMRDMETFSIHDSIGRMVPFTYSDLPAVIYTLQSLHDLTAEAVNNFTTARDYLEGEKIATY